MRKLTLLAGALLLAAPIFAGGPMEGWYGGVGTGFIQSSDNMVVTTTYDYAATSNNAYGGNRRLDYGSKPVLNLWAGYNSAMGDFRLSYWGYNRSANVSVRGTPYDWATAVNLDLYGHGYDDVDLNSRIKTQQWDIDWTHNMMSGDKGSLGWSIGLRHFKTERVIAWTGIAYDCVSCAGPAVPAAAPIHAVSVSVNGSEAKGFGITTGLSGTIKFNDRFSMDSGFKVGYVNGSVDYALMQVGTYAHVYTYNFSDSHKNQSFRTTEMSLRGNVQIWSGLSGYIGYENRRQEGTLGEFDTIQYNNTFIQDFKTSDMTYSGIVLGMNWKF